MHDPYELKHWIPYVSIESKGLPVGLYGPNGSQVPSLSNVSTYDLHKSKLSASGREI